MPSAPDTDPAPLDAAAPMGEPPLDAAEVTPTPTLADLSAESSSRLIRYIVTSALEHGVAPMAVVALYADLGGDADAVRYADRRFTLREIPPDWREIEDRVADLEMGAQERLGPTQRELAIRR